MPSTDPSDHNVGQFVQAEAVDALLRMEGVQVIGENSDGQTGGSRVTHQRERFRSQQVVGNSLVQGPTRPHGRTRR
jgi:hypothetical protein